MIYFLNYRISLFHKPFQYCTSIVCHSPHKIWSHVIDLECVISWLRIRTWLACLSLSRLTKGQGLFFVYKEMLEFCNKTNIRNVFSIFLPWISNFKLWVKFLDIKRNLWDILAFPYILSHWLIISIKICRFWFKGFGFQYSVLCTPYITSPNFNFCFHKLSSRIEIIKLKAIQHYQAGSRCHVI